MIPLARKTIILSTPETDADALRLFRAGHDTLEIASLLATRESIVVRMIDRAREKERAK